MNKIDQWLVAKAQAVYLWMFDWTGVRVGMVLFVLAGMANFLWWLSDGSWIAVFLIGFMGIFGVWLSWIQDSDQKHFNVIAMTQEESIVRKGFTLLILSFFIMYCLMLSWRGIFAEALWFAYCYMLCVKVRDREPKEFKFFKLATAGAR